jgi:hypothetical protein
MYKKTSDLKENCNLYAVIVPVQATFKHDFG